MTEKSQAVVVRNKLGQIMSSQTAGERFWAKVQQVGPDECWLWTATCTTDGYGWFRPTKAKQGTSSNRMAWMLTNGPIPSGLQVLHRCDNPKCCNPKHLFLGTNLDNRQDMMTKKRQARGEANGRAVPYRRAGKRNS